MLFLYSFIKSAIVWVRQTTFKYYKIISDYEERKNYIAEEGNKILFLMIYVLLNMVVLIYPLVHYIPISKAAGTPWYFFPKLNIGLQLQNVEVGY